MTERALEEAAAQAIQFLRGLPDRPVGSAATAAGSAPPTTKPK